MIDLRALATKADPTMHLFKILKNTGDKYIIYINNYDYEMGQNLWKQLYANPDKQILIYDSRDLSDR